jgi:hypothetical protein
MKPTAILNLSVVLLLAGSASGQPPDQGPGCSNDTLKGYYGGVITGTRPAPSVIAGQAGFPGQIEQIIALVRWTFDGKGNFTQVISGKGTVSGFGEQPISGTYSVNADCIATVMPVIPGLPPSVIKLVIVDSGREFQTIVQSPQAAMISGTHRKMN